MLELSLLFDKNGNITTLTDNLRSNIRSFIYDDLDRLSEAGNLPAPGGGYTTFNYQYDSIGNMTYKSDVGVMSYGEGLSPQGTVPKPHALTSAAGYTYRYDANGNMTVGKNKTLAYDTENRLTEVNELGTITSFIYDGDGGRVRKTTGPPANPLTQTTYIGSLFEKDSDGTVRKHIFAGANRVCSINWQTGTPANRQTYYYHPDHLGSSSIITDASGQQVQYCEYTPYGTLARNEGTDVVKHKFTGKELDSTGLYFYGARYYDPQLGRFITADTIVQAPYDPQSLNRYSYCRNNPINYIDPTGHLWWWVIPAIIGAVIGGATGAISAAAAGGEVWKGALFGALFGAVTGVIGYGTGQAMLAAAEKAGQAITPLGGALITGTEFGIGGIGPGMASGFAGGKGGFLDVLKGGAIGFGTGFVTGAAVGYSYARGWQSLFHGADIQGTNTRIFMNQVGNGDYAGATRTLAIDDPLRFKLIGARVEESALAETQLSKLGLYLHGTDIKGGTGISISRQLTEGSWLTTPGAVDPVTGKIAIKLNPVEYQRFTSLPRQGEVFALVVAPKTSIMDAGIAGGGAPQYRVYGPHMVTEVFPNLN